MTIRPARLVLDTNTMVRAFYNWDSPSGIIVKQCQSHALRLMLSSAVLAEYRKVLRYDRIATLRALETQDAVEDVLDRLRYVSEFPFLTGVRFEYARDSTDEKFIELAIAGKATHLITRDKDLLSLGRDFSEVAKRFRHRAAFTRIIRPEQFLAERNN